MPSTSKKKHRAKCVEYIKSCTLMRSSDLVDLAFEIYVEDKTTFYDSLFLAAAEKEQVPLLTLYKNLHEKVKASRNVQMV